MRKSKLEEINNKIKKLSTKYIEEIKQDDNYITIIPYKVTLNNDMVIYREKIMKGGTEGSSVAILPILKDINEIVLVIEPRVFTEKTVGISTPAGYVDGNEDPLKAAIRELEEETGLKSNDIVNIGDFYKDFGNASALSTQFIAFDCEKKGKQHFDDDEMIDLVLVSLEEADELIEMKYIRDACSIILIKEAIRMLNVK